jgi:glutaminyl-tRNA synthetase
MNAYFIRCEKVMKNADGDTVELHCTYDPKTKSGSGFSGRKVKGTLHWVEASHALPAEFRLFEPLVDPDAHSTSLAIAHGFVEPGMEQVQANDKFQFVRHGYFNVDEGLTAANHLVFNRIVSLKSSF